MRHCRTLNLSLKDVQVLFVCLYLFSVSNTLFADFRLVVICADEDHGRSFCASRLSAYQRKIHPLPLDKEIMDYLHSHFSTRFMERSIHNNHNYRIYKNINFVCLQ